MPLLEILFGGIATLLATLVGVGLAFWLDRRAEKRKKQKRILQHLKAVQKELEMNESIGWGNRSLISKMQEMNEPKADHYAPSLFITDAWDTAIQDQLIDVVPPDLYHDLQELYQKTKSTNELVRRLRIEAVDPRLGELVQDGSWEYQNWTYSVYYHDGNSEEVDYLGLGPLILRRSRSIASNTDTLQQKVNEVIEDLEKRLSETETEEQADKKESASIIKKR